MHLVEEAGAFELGDEAALDESFGVGAGNFGAGARKQVEHRFHHARVEFNCAAENEIISMGAKAVDDPGRFMVFVPFD